MTAKTNTKETYSYEEVWQFQIIDRML